MTARIHLGGVVAITPDDVELESLDRSTRSRTITHEILDGPPVHTLRVTSPHTGTIRLVFHARGAAGAAFETLGAADVFTITDTDEPSLNFRFVVTDVQMTADLAGLTKISVAYQAVTT